MQLSVVPSAEAKMVAVPGFFAVITPLLSTVATLFLLERKVTGRPVDAVADSLAQYPFSSEIDLALSWILVAATRTVQLASPFLIFAVILAVPAFFAVIFPYVFTDATFELLEEKEGFFPVEVMAAR